MSVDGELYVCSKSRSQRSSAIVAHWPNVIGIDPRAEAPLRAAIDSYFFRHQLQVKSRSSNVTVLNTKKLAHVKWLEDHPYRDRYIPMSFVSARTYARESY